MSPYTVTRDFEKSIAAYAGSTYAVSVSSCTNALLLCCIYYKVKWVHIPRFTYPGVACSIINAGGKVGFTNEKWQGAYQLRPYPVYDSALRFKRNMYIDGSLYCLSFHHKKHLPIGQGGMILTDSIGAYTWLKMMRYDGRRECPLSEDNLSLVGFNMYLTPEQSARGLVLFSNIKDKELPDLKVEEQNYPDLSRVMAYKT
jgi:dTDP-4-amino-4,6-dideoxygalactose transaminase